MTQKKPKPNRITFKGLLRQMVVFGGTVVVLSLAVVAVMLSSQLLAERAAAVVAPEAAPNLRAESMYVKLQDQYRVTRQFSGQIEAGRTADISFETGGTITAIFVDEGDAVLAGDVIAQLDTRLLEAERARLTASRDALGAQLELAQRELDRQTQLQASGLALAPVLDNAELGLTELNARIAGIDASIASVSVQLDKAILRAPFDATVAARFVDEGISIGSGAGVVSLLEDGPAQFRVGIDPALTDQIVRSEMLVVTIDGVNYPAKLAALRPDLDPVSRTRTVLLDVDNVTAAYQQSGLLRLEEIVEAQVYEVPLSALREGVRGLWTVLTLSEGADGLYIVGFEAVELIHADNNSAFVRGTLQNGQRIIASGTHRVVTGQIVRITPDTAG